MQATRELPKRLTDFLTRYPPSLYSAKFTGVTIPLTRREEKSARDTSARNGSSASAENTPVPTATSPSSENPNPSNTDYKMPEPVSRKDRDPPNPFMPFRNPETGRWRGAVIGLRRQAELVKLAKKYEIEQLLPPGKKSTAFKEQRTLTKGLRVRGTGEDQTVKGHKWERQQGAIVEKRKKAMQEMPALIREWKQKGHGRGWKKYPK